MYRATIQISISTRHHPQTGPHWHKLNSGLLQYPRFNFDVPQMQQVKFPLDVVLFGYRAWLVPHNLRNNSGGDFHPFRQRAKGAAQTMQGKRRKGSGGQCLIYVTTKSVFSGIPINNKQGGSA
jgi:hypothetical protein